MTTDDERTFVAAAHHVAADRCSTADADAPGFDAAFAGARRIELEPSAWVDHVAGWVHGADELFEQSSTGAPWEQRRVHMYDRMVDEPRLTAWYGAGPRRTRRSRP